MQENLKKCYFLFYGRAACPLYNNVAKQPVRAVVADHLSYGQEKLTFIVTLLLRKYKTVETSRKFCVTKQTVICHHQKAYWVHKTNEM